MKTPRTHHDFTPLLAAEVIHAEQIRYTEPPLASAMEAPLHDFLVLNPRADLATEVTYSASHFVLQ